MLFLTKRDTFLNSLLLRNNKRICFQGQNYGTLCIANFVSSWMSSKICKPNPWLIFTVPTESFFSSVLSGAKNRIHAQSHARQYFQIMYLCESHMQRSKSAKCKWLSRYITFQRCHLKLENPRKLTVKLLKSRLNLTSDYCCKGQHWVNFDI